MPIITLQLRTYNDTKNYYIKIILLLKLHIHFAIYLQLPLLTDSAGLLLIKIIIGYKRCHRHMPNQLSNGQQSVTHGFRNWVITSRSVAAWTNFERSADSNWRITDQTTTMWRRLSFFRRGTPLTTTVDGTRSTISDARPVCTSDDSNAQMSEQMTNEQYEGPKLWCRWTGESSTFLLPNHHHQWFCQIQIA